VLLISIHQVWAWAGRRGARAAGGRRAGGRLATARTAGCRGRRCLPVGQRLHQRALNAPRPCKRLPPPRPRRQDCNYPIGSGAMSEGGAGPGAGFTLNLPLPPGCGSGAYRAAFDRVVSPALDAYRPQLILVSAGFDASAMDPLATMMVTAADYGYFGQARGGGARGGGGRGEGRRWEGPCRAAPHRQAPASSARPRGLRCHHAHRARSPPPQVLRAAADRHCPGRLVGLHEGGYRCARGGLRAPAPLLRRPPAPPRLARRHPCAPPPHPTPQSPNPSCPPRSEFYVPFCGLAFIEALAGAARPKVLDPIAGDVHKWGYQGLQPWQDAVIEAAERGPLTRLRAAVAGLPGAE
jgi:hypothetical protein